MCCDGQATRGRPGDSPPASLPGGSPDELAPPPLRHHHRAAADVRAALLRLEVIGIVMALGVEPMPMRLLGWRPEDCQKP